MTLRSRLGLGLVTIAIILLAPLFFAIHSLYRLNDDVRALRDREFAASLLLGRMREGLNDLRREELALLFSKDSASRNAMDQQLTQVDRLADSLSRLELPAPARNIAASVRQVAAAAPAEYLAALANKPKVADSISEGVFLPALSHADSAVLIAERELRSRTTDRVNHETVVIAQTATVSVVALLLALIVAASVAVWLTRSISRPIEDLKSGMASVADGDLSYRLNVKPTRADEFGILAQSFQEMTRQLGELDKLKAEFVSVASHELKTPINVIIGYLQLLEEGVYGPLNDRQKEIHRTVGVQAQSLNRLVKQLLDVSRFEAGGGRLETRSMSLEEFLRELERAFHVLASQREIQFVVERGADLPEEVVWDPDRVNEVLGNLLSNAFKFTPHGGSVCLDVTSDGTHVTMRVRDTGAGIPPEQLPRIFEKFYQADNQRAAGAGGTGLGLAIAKEIVDAHGGTISCQSTVGTGTTFTITLPVHATRRSSHRMGLLAVGSVT